MFNRKFFNFRENLKERNAGKMNDAVQAGRLKSGSFLTAPDKVLIEATGLVKKYGQRLAVGAHINAGNIVGIFLLVLLSFAATSLGILIASLLKTENGIRPVILIIGLLGALLGGSWFPLWLMPDGMQQISKITINSWAMNGFNNLMIFGQGLSQVLPNLLALLIYGVVCLGLASRFFSYSES